MRSAIAFLACLLVLGLVNYSVAKKERLLENGRVVHLELAPVDPRSLMQGDYMALEYRVATDTRAEVSRLRSQRPAEEEDLPPADGRVVVALDARGVATYRRLDDGKPLAQDEIYLRYRVRGGQVKFATNAYFFEERTAERYEPARYGEFRVSDDGDLLLTRLRGKDLEPL